MRNDPLLSLSIRRAASVDASEVHSLAAAWAFVDRADRARSGFLVSGFTASDYRRFARVADHFYVASTAGGGLCGFALAYSSERIDRAAEWTNSRVSEVVREPFVVIKQVAVAPGSESRGVGSALYEDLKRRTGGRPLVAAIVTNPENRRSISFHERHGFRHVMTLVPPGEERMPRAIYRWDPVDRGDRP